RAFLSTTSPSTLSTTRPSSWLKLNSMRCVSLVPTSIENFMAISSQHINCHLFLACDGCVRSEFWHETRRPLAGFDTEARKVLDCGNPLPQSRTPTPTHP